MVGEVRSEGAESTSHTGAGLGLALWALGVREAQELGWGVVRVRDPLTAWRKGVSHRGVPGVPAPRPRAEGCYRD